MSTRDDSTVDHRPGWHVQTALAADLIFEGAARAFWSRVRKLGAGPVMTENGPRDDAVGFINYHYQHQSTASR